ncbi:hypothetical protein F5Y16DRAFT_419269 [Xylariaceae sp. FL0255]|nr:hypothetical protein F5Y16DRAFT_419269 [Xylariaceae sp. FL0255]
MFPPTTRDLALNLFRTFYCILLLGYLVILLRDWSSWNELYRRPVLFVTLASPLLLGLFTVFLQSKSRHDDKFLPPLTPAGVNTRNELYMGVFSGDLASEYEPPTMSHVLVALSRGIDMSDESLKKYVQNAIHYFRTGEQMDSGNLEPTEQDIKVYFGYTQTYLMELEADHKDSSEKSDPFVLIAAHRPDCPDKDKISLAELKGLRDRMQNPGEPRVPREATRCTKGSIIMKQGGFSIREMLE